MVSIYEVGCMFGAIAVLIWGERIGRRLALIIGGTVVVIGAILQVTSYSRAQFIVARIVTGVGNGINTSTVGIYQSETSPAKNRGRLVTVEGIMAIGGAMISYWLDFGMSYTNSTAQWRFPLAFQMVFALGMTVTAVFLPDTPRWLVAHKRHDEAKEVIAALADVSPEDESVATLHLQIQEAIEYESSQAGEFSYRELFTGGDLQNFRRMCLCFGIQLMEEMGGANMITYYMSVVFSQMGVSHILSLLLSGVNSTVYFISAWGPVFYIERFGRKKLLVYGSIGMMCTMIMLSITLSHPNQVSGGFSILAIFLFEIFYATGGWMATPFLYPSEISTLRLRSKGSAISVFSKWTFNFLVVMISPVAIANIKWRVYILWAVLNFVFIFVVWFFYPETKGLTLEETNRIFEGGDPITRGAYSFRPKTFDGSVGQRLHEKDYEANTEHREVAKEA